MPTLLARKLRSVTLAFFFTVLCIEQPSNADVIVRTDFDASTSVLDSNVSLVGMLNQTFTASIRLELTGDSRLAQYKFSVQFNSSALEYVSRSDLAPIYTSNPGPNGETETIPWAPVTLDRPGASSNRVNHFDAQNLLPDFRVLPQLTASDTVSVLTVATLTFKVINESASGALITPGLFSNPFDDVQLDGIQADGFWYEDEAGNWTPHYDSDFDVRNNVARDKTLYFQGVTSITAVPEPSSALLLAIPVLGSLALKRFSKRSRVKSGDAE